MMTDIGDVAITLMMDGRLIGAPALKIVVADKAHIHRLGRRPDLLLGRGYRAYRPKDRDPEGPKDYGQACPNAGFAF
jgi:hypothetical protein